MNTLRTLLLAGLMALMAPANGAAGDPRWFSQAELDQMLAPVALYPDTVLSHVLIAATYPLEVVQAARWSRNNPGLSGEDAVHAVEYMDWDPSVKALVAFPELLTRLDGDLDWTQALGDAFLLQEDQVVGTIQELRARAYAHGHLQTNERVRVVRETEYIYIEPAVTRVVYVPYYDPRVVYGPWWWPTYPPVYWHRPPGVHISLGFHWGVGYRVAPHFYFSSFHWPRRQVVVVHHHHHHHHHRTRRSFSSGREVAHYQGARHWQHNPEHRRGVSYSRGAAPRHLAGSQAATRQAPARSAQVRGNQRDWAADQRSSLDLRRAATQRGEARQQSGANAPRSRQERVSGSNRTDTPATARQAAAPRSTAATQRQSASGIGDRLAGRDAARSQPDATRTRPATSTRAQPARSTAPASRTNPSAAATRQAPARDAAATSRQPQAERPASRAPAQRPATATQSPRTQTPSAPARQPQARTAPAAPAQRQAPAQRSAPAQREAPVQRSAPAQREAPAQRAAPAQRSSANRSARSRDRDR